MNQLLVIDGISVRQDKIGRYCLNDLHRAAGGEDRHKPGNFFRLDNIKELCLEIDRCSDVSIASVESIRGGPNQGTYVCKELVFAYAMWISAAFNLKVIRTYDATASHKGGQSANDMMQAGVTLLGFMRKELNLSNSSVLGACQKLQDAVGLPNLAPQYAIDAPNDAVDGSSRPTTSLTTMLRDNMLSFSVRDAYERLEELGLVQHLSRPSNSARAVGGRKKFWSVTTNGLKYGKNVTSPNNPRETQPHFYTSKSAELIKMMLAPAVKGGQ